MKRIYSIFAVVLIAASFFLSQQSNAQSPEKMSYQAVIRDAGNGLVTSSPIGMQISILQGTPVGTAVYTETQSPTTNSNGLVTVEIGTGVTSDDFSTIDWTNGPYFIKTETDPTTAGGTNYTITGTSQLLSVPFALYAKTAGSISGGITETDPVFGASPANGITSTNITNWNTAYSWGDHASMGYLTSFNETDPIFGASPANGITSTNVSNWNTAFGWGNHATAGYLTSFTETDPLWSASPSFGITSTNVSYWNTAYSWGNHATAGYLTSYTETDPLFTYNFNVTSPTNGQLIWYNSVSGKWENFTPTFLTAEVDGSVTNEIELPTQTGNSGRYLTTDGTSPSWVVMTKSTIGLGNVENTALSTWAGSSNITTLGTISSGTWQGSAINALYIGNLPASQVTSGVFDNARINWAAPGTIGSTTASSGAFTSLSANSGLSVSNGLVNIKPSGSGGTSGNVLTSDGTGNATWQAPAGSSIPVSVQNATYTILPSDGLIITNGTVTFTLPSAAAAGMGKTIYLYSKVTSITLVAVAGDTIWDNSGNSHTSPGTMTSYSGMYISDGVNTWYEVTK